MKQLVVHARDAEEGVMSPVYVVAVTGQGVFADVLRPEWKETAQRVASRLNAELQRRGDGPTTGPRRDASPPS